MLEMVTNQDLEYIENLSRKEKVLYFLKKNPKRELANEELVDLTGIDKSNLSKILKSLEEKEKIKRRYEQIGRSKYVWISLTNSHNKMTNSQDQKTTNSHIKHNTKSKDISKHVNNTISKNSSKKKTNSHSKMTNSQDQKTTNSQKKQIDFINKRAVEFQKFGKNTSIDKMQENTIFLRENKVDLIDAVDTFLKAYKNYEYDKVMRQKKRMRKIKDYLEGLN